MLGRSRSSCFVNHFQSRLLFLTFGKRPSHLAKGSDAESDVFGCSYLLGEQMAGEKSSVADKGGHVVKERVVDLAANDVHDGFERLVTAIRRHLDQAQSDVRSERRSQDTGFKVPIGIGECTLLESITNVVIYRNKPTNQYRNLEMVALAYSTRRYVST